MLRLSFSPLQLAAKRFAYYWDKRIEVCGADRAFLPFTLEGALKGDDVALKIGFVNYVAGATDPEGRGVIYVNPAMQDKSKYTRDSLTRAVWYMIHAALESPDAQKHGIIFIGHPKGAKLGQFDRLLVKQMLSSIQGALPTRLSAFHVCQPPPFVKIVLPIAKLFMTERTKKRLCIHFGSKESVCEKLQGYGMTKASIPQNLGGDAPLDICAWLDQRRAQGK